MLLVPFEDLLAEVTAWLDSPELDSDIDAAVEAILTYDDSKDVTSSTTGDDSRSVDSDGSGASGGCG